MNKECYKYRVNYELEQRVPAGKSWVTYMYLFKNCSARPRHVPRAPDVPSAGLAARPPVPLRRLPGAGEEVVQGRPRDRLGRHTAVNRSVLEEMTENTLNMS